MIQRESLRDESTRDAEEFLRCFRSAEGVPVELHRRVARFPTIDLVRGELRKADVPSILRAAGVGPEDGGGVSFALLTPFAEEDVVSAYLIEQWGRATGFLRKNNILWPLLENRSLSNEYHEEGFKFVQAYLKRFTDNCAVWWGPQAELLETIRKRITYPHTPRTKYWIYLCVAMASGDRSRVVALLEEFLDDPHSINAFVAKELRARLAAS